ncbi:hypothetical protein RND81_03G144000 [Saponaria officinalis]|uniref:PPM-type phosphatase domain-containing protein n=1 Tax=Saponaria officinalis TaxID=3572 RepID=A0AAW1M6Q2_SAPOF
MGIRVSTAASVNSEGLSSVLHDQGRQRVVGCLHSRQGDKGVNQDSAVMFQGYGAEEGLLCGVFDGHGKYGHLVSKVVKERLPLLLLEQKNANTDVDENSSESQETSEDDSSSNSTFHEWETTCVNAFEKMDEEIKKVKFDASFSGTTAVVALKQGDELVIANLGDSRAILGTKQGNEVAAVQLTIDLKPGTPDEKDRIKGSNGRVFAVSQEPDLERAWLPRVYSPGMAMSRAFGDLVMKNYGIISTPVVTHHHITSDDLFVVVATDGIWDVLSNEEVTSIVWEAKTEEMAAKAVVDAAVKAWKTKFPRDKADDCTAICFFLQYKDEAEAPAS